MLTNDVQETCQALHMRFGSEAEGALLSWFCIDHPRGKLNLKD